MHERPIPRLLTPALLIACLVAVLVASSAALRAQTPEGAQIPPETEDARAGEDPTPAARNRGEDSRQDRPPADPPDAPLEDYEASEQISEDLSVSFPVDI